MDEQRHVLAQGQVPIHHPPPWLAQWRQQFALLVHPFPLPTQPQVVRPGQAFGCTCCKGGGGEGDGGLGGGGDGLGGNALRWTNQRRTNQRRLGLGSPSALDDARLTTWTARCVGGPTAAVLTRGCPPPTPFAVALKGGSKPTRQPRVKLQ